MIQKSNNDPYHQRFNNPLYTQDHPRVGDARGTALDSEMLKNLKRDREELVVDVPNSHAIHKSAAQLG